MPLGYRPPAEDQASVETERATFDRVANETGWLDLLGNSTLAQRFRDAINGSTPAVNGTGWEWLIGQAYERRRAGPNGTFSELPAFTPEELEALAVLAAAGDPAAYLPREGPNGTVLPPLVNRTTQIPPLRQANASDSAPFVPIVIEGVPVVFSAVQVLQCEDEDLSAVGAGSAADVLEDDDAVGDVTSGNNTSGGAGRRRLSETLAGSVQWADSPPGGPRAGNGPVSQAEAEGLLARRSSQWRRRRALANSNDGTSWAPSEGRFQVDWEQAGEGRPRQRSVLNRRGARPASYDATATKASDRRRNRRLQDSSGAIVIGDETTAGGQLARCLAACRGTFQPTSGSGNDVDTGLCTTYWKLTHACIVVSHARPTRIDDTASVPGCAVADDGLLQIGLASIPAVFDGTTNLGPFGYSLIDIVGDADNQENTTAGGTQEAATIGRRASEGDLEFGGDEAAADRLGESQSAVADMWLEDEHGGGWQDVSGDVLPHAGWDDERIQADETELEPVDSSGDNYARQLQDDAVVLYRSPPTTVDLSRVSLTVRSNRDPYVAALRLSKGTLSFGTEPSELAITALSLILAAVLVCIAPLGLLYCAVVCCLLGDRRSVEEAPASYFSIDGAWGSRKALGSSGRRFHTDLDWRETLLFMRQGDILGAGEALARNLRGVLQQVAVDVGQLGQGQVGPEPVERVPSGAQGVDAEPGGVEMALARRGSELPVVPRGYRSHGGTHNDMTMTLDDVAAAVVVANGGAAAQAESGGPARDRRGRRAGTVDVGGATGTLRASGHEGVDGEGMPRGKVEKSVAAGLAAADSALSTGASGGARRHARAVTMMSPGLLDDALDGAGLPPAGTPARRQLHGVGHVTKVSDVRGGWGALGTTGEHPAGSAGSRGGAVLDSFTGEVLSEAPLWAIPSGELLRAGGVTPEGSRHILAPWIVSETRLRTRLLEAQLQRAQGRRSSHGPSAAAQVRLPKPPAVSSLVAPQSRHARSQSIANHGSARGSAVRKAIQHLRRAVRSPSSPHDRLLRLLSESAAARAALGICPAVGESTGDVLADRRMHPVETHGRLALPDQVSPVGAGTALWRRQEWRERKVSGGSDASADSAAQWRMRHFHRFARELGWCGIPRVVRPAPVIAWRNGPGWGAAQERSLQAVVRACSSWNFGRVLHPLDLPIGSSWADQVAIVQRQQLAGARLHDPRFLCTPVRTSPPQRSTGLVFGVVAWAGAADFVLALDLVRGRSTGAVDSRSTVDGEEGKGGQASESGEDSDSGDSMIQDPSAPRLDSRGPTGGRSYLARRPLKPASPSGGGAAADKGKLAHETPGSRLAAIGAARGVPGTGPRTPISPMAASVGAESAVEHDLSVPRGLAGPMAMRRKKR